MGLIAPRIFGAMGEQSYNTRTIFEYVHAGPGSKENVYVQDR
jgi:hypothetical protein